MDKDERLHEAGDSRRQFCLHACQALSAVTLGALLPGCGGGGGNPAGPGGSVNALPTVTGTVANGAVSVTVDASSPLATVGNAALVNTSSGQLLVARTAQDSFTALTAICTHQSCTITGFDGGVYVCPCHGSRFNTAGAVLSGPATVALHAYTTSFAGNVLTIT